jgi:uncharacterized membrane protein
MRNILDGLIRYHRFLAWQSLYPLLLSSAFALALFIARVLYSNTTHYKNLVWNLLLAWLPYLFSFVAITLHHLFPKKWWMIIVPGSLWLIFFPNAPYIVTDFLHLEERPFVPIWYDILLLAAFAWTGFFLAIASLRTMQVLVRHYLGGILSWMFALGALSLSGLGIYLGRFSRWNSWDLLFQPKEILRDVAIRLINPFDNLRFFAFSVLFTVFLLVCYLTFLSIRKENKNE